MFRRLGNLIRGFLSLFISGLEKANPRALIEAEKENLRRQIARFNDNLANHAAFVERLMRQIKKLQGQEELQPRWKRCVSATDRAMGEMLGQAFVDRYFAGDSKEIALAMIRGIESSRAAP